MRNPLKRLTHADWPKRPMRERLAGAKTKLVAVKEKYGRTLRVHRALNAPLPTPAPGVDRVALVNYATWLDFERHRVCAELYPHMGAKATRFTIGLNAAERFFHPEDGKTKDVPPASSRALKVLDLVGVDWREDTGEIDRKRYDDGGRADTGERPAVPYGWPALDADLTEALDNLTRLDAAIEAMHSGGPHRTGDLLPGLEGLEWGRNEALDRLNTVRARGLPGLQAKAHAILADSVQDGDTDHFHDIAESLARDLIGALPSVLDQHRPDRSIAAIEEVKRLEAACTAEYAKGNDGDATPEQSAAASAVMDQWNGVVLKIVPSTAAGCAALTRFAVGFCDRWGISLEGDGETVLNLIARSPLRS